MHRFSADGRLIQSWGEPGTGPGQFHLPHAIAVAPDGRVLVADRENDRIQVFSPDGEYLEEWTAVQRPCGLHMGHDGRVYVGELAWPRGWRSYTRGEIQEESPARVSVLDLHGAVLARWGGYPPCAPGNVFAPHGICIDSRGDVYVAEVTGTAAKNAPHSGVLGPVEPGCHTFQKFARR